MTFWKGIGKPGAARRKWFRPFLAREKVFHMLGSFFTDALVVVVVLGIMIFIHEAGHFMAAKSFGVRVLVFSLGFGKTLLHIKRGDTDYRISALPFGGYVKMAGDDPSEVRQGDRGEFLSQAPLEALCDRGDGAGNERPAGRRPFDGTLQVSFSAPGLPGATRAHRRRGRRRRPQPRPISNPGI